MSWLIQKPTMAFFGATGGTAQSALIYALRGGHHVVALARSPDKLTTQLKTQGLSEDILKTQLTIVVGSTLDKDKVKLVLTGGNEQDRDQDQSHHLVSHIFSGIGGKPSINFNLWNPFNPVSISNDQPTICTDSASTLLTALSEIYKETPELQSQTQMPHLTCVSTTGISRGVEDVPWGLQTLYHHGLAEPHRDKKGMEDLFRNHIEGKDKDQHEQYSGSKLIADLIVVRPTLLRGGSAVDSDCLGLDKVRAGTEDKPAVGWMVYRADVGHWIFENALNEEGRKVWANQMVSLTN